ncbi:hypothetical protein [Streptomyces sp. NPDC001137]|uniref:hypothetical protein n=1 Tax=Streptomyces sp. NPDC001137 TaxID=3154378 RepID=UPI003329819A
MKGLAQRYLASLTDSSPEAWDRLIAQGRRRDLPLWRRYVASLLDVNADAVVAGRERLEGEVLEQERAERDPPASTVYYTLDSTIDVRGGGPVPGGRRVFAGIMLAAAAFAAVVALGFSLVLIGREAENAVGAAPPLSPAPSTGEASRTGSPTVEGTSRPTSLPPRAHEEAGGYAWVTPTGWRRDVKTGNEVHYASPDGAQELAAKSSLARGDLMETWQKSEQNAHQGQGYRKIRLEKTTFDGNPAVVWEYTFTLKGTPWHARLLGFEQDGKSYQINTWYHPDIEAQALKIYDKVKGSFTVL